MSGDVGLAVDWLVKNAYHDCGKLSTAVSCYFSTNKNTLRILGGRGIEDDANNVETDLL